MCPQQLLLDLPVRPNYSPADFVESTCNQEAVRWVHRWPDWPMTMMAIYGEKGCGKTHLAHIWQQKSAARYLTSADIPHLSPFEATQEANAFVLDDADILAQEEWLFHFYNSLKEKNAYLLICCQRPPTQWAIHLPDLRSRLSTLFSVEIAPPDEEALRAVLFKRCSERGMVLSTEAGDYILRRIERSFASIGCLVETLDQYALSAHRQPTLGLIREVFKKGEDNPFHLSKMKDGAP